MMNILGLSLVVTSLAAAGLWSPSPQRQYVGASEGHRVIVVEYDEDAQHGTKVHVSPPPPQQQPKPAKYFSKEGLKEAASVLPNLGQGISPGGKAGPGSHVPGELICDAFGKCTQTFASVFDKAKDKVSETADEAKHKLGEIASKAKGALAEKDRVLKESANECIDKAEDAVGTVKETAETARCHIVNNSTEKAEMAREKTERKAKSGANKLFIAMEALNPVMGIANLLGLASAYGMSVWVTFISSTVLAEALPRLQFGVVQINMHDVHSKAMGFSVGLALLGHLLGQRRTLFCSKTDMFQAFNLMCSFLLVLVNALYFKPKATKVLLERMKVEKEGRRGRDGFVVGEAAMKSRESPTAASATIARLNERLKKLNAKSSLVNVVTLVPLTWHLLYLAHRISSNRG
ncbi:hypothetical protein GQ457_07G020130 [Hibiscus cannabinus]